MPVIHHSAPAHGATYGATPRAAKFVAGAHAPRPAALAFLWVRALTGCLVGFALGGACLALLAASVLLTPLFPFYLAAEALFAAHFFRRLAALSRVPERHEPADAAETGPEAFERFLEAAAKMPPGAVETLIARWCRALPGYGATAAASFLTRTSSSILNGVTKGNAAEMLLYGFLYRARGDLPEGTGEAMVARLEQAWGREFAPGEANPALKLMAHLREPVRAHWRPLAFYLGTEVIALAKHCALICAGWKCGSIRGGATFYTYGACSSSAAASSDLPPILFCHGVGLGLAPYVPMVQRLAATGRPVIAVEFKHLAMRWTSRVPTVGEAAAELACILASLGAKRVDAVGHSFGTFFLARLLRTRPDLVRTIALLDPVCCCMWTGDLVSSFVYRPHASRTGLVTWLIARDLHAAAAVSRGFFWSDYELWPQDLEAMGKRALLAVGGRDDLVPASHVAATLAERGKSGGSGKAAVVTMLHDEARVHADVVFRPAWQRRALDEALAQMAAADCEELAEELAAVAKEAAVAAAVEAVAAASVVAPSPSRPATPLAAAPRFALAAAIARKRAAATGCPAAPAERSCSVPAACADGDEQQQQFQPLLPMQRSYTIAAGVFQQPHHVRSDSGSSVGTVAHFAADFAAAAQLDDGAVVEEDKEEEEEEPERAAERLLRRLGKQTPFAGAQLGGCSAAARAVAAALPRSHEAIAASAVAAAAAR